MAAAALNRPLYLALYAAFLSKAPNLGRANEYIPGTYGRRHIPFRAGRATGAHRRACVCSSGNSLIFHNSTYITHCCRASP